MSQAGESNSALRVVRNAAFNSGGWGVSAVLGIIATPYLISRLTIEGFGIYSIITGLSGYCLLLDLGLGQGIVKFIAEYRAKQDSGAINRTINTVLVIQFISGLAGVAALLICSQWLLVYLKVSPSFFNDATFCLYVSATGLLFTLFSGTLSSALMGMQRYDITAKIATSTTSISTVITVIALLLGHGLKTAVTINVLSGVVQFCVYLYAVRRVVPGWKFELKSAADIAHLRKLFSFSGYLYLMNISAFINTFFIRFIISATLGPAFVTIYVVPMRIIGALSGLLSSAFGVLFPVASALSCQSNRAKLNALFLDASRLFASLAIPGFCLMAVFAKPSLTLWMGKDFSDSAHLIFSILAISALIGSLTTVPNHFIIGFGHTKIRSIISIMVITLNIVFLPIATQSRGVLGASIVLLVGNILALTVLLVLVKQLLQIDVLNYIKKTAGFHLIPVTLVAILYYQIQDSAINSYWMVSIAIISAIAYLSAMTYTGWLPIKRLLAAGKRQ